MFGCTVDGGLVPIITGTRGVNQTPVRSGIGVVEVQLDQPMAPNEYSATAIISEPIGPDACCVVTKKLVLGVAKIEVQTLVGGVAADADFDLTLFRFAQINA